MKKKIRYVHVPLMMMSMLIIGLATSGLSAQTKCDNCSIWQAKVDPTIRSERKIEAKSKRTLSEAEVIVLRKNGGIDFTRKFEIVDLTESSTFEAIECLLKLKGNKQDSSIVGATRPETSQMFGASTVEVAALYFISYLYHEDWGHAGAAALVGTNGKMNTEEVIAAAFQSYEVWFEIAKQTGLEAARKQRLDSLAGSGVRWY